MDAISTVWSGSTGRRRGVALPSSSLTGPGIPPRPPPKVFRLEGSEKPLGCLLERFCFQLRDREGTSVSHRSCCVPLSHSAPGGADVELASPGPSWRRAPRERPHPVPSVPSGRASCRHRLPAPGSRQRRRRRPGSLWAAGGEWQAPASPSHSPVSVSPPPAAAVAGHLCAAEPSRAAPRRAACWPQGCRRGGCRLPRLPAVTLGGDSRGWRRGQERPQPEPAAPRPAGGGDRGGGRAGLRLPRRAALHFLSPSVALLEAPDYK